MTDTASVRERWNTEIVPFRAGDGFECNFHHVTGDKAPTKGPVILVHGAGVRGNIFRAPVETNIVDYLIEQGYDVWLENWRASIDFSPNLWNLDQAAVHDHPAAVRTVVERTGCEEVKAIIHCQGSTSFAMSAVAGLIPEVKTIVTNAVSLHTVVPRWSRFKLQAMLPFVRWVTSYLNPQWGRKAPGFVPKVIDFFVKLFHHECGNGVCKHVSFTYGSGKPALWRHENLNEETHEWLRQEFAHVPLRFFEQMSRCVRSGHLVSTGEFPELPESFVAQPPKTEARFAFFAGVKNRCFLPESQERSHAFLASQSSGSHTIHLLPDYGHLDVFMGKDAAKAIFPQMVAELENRPA